MDEILIFFGVAGAGLVGFTIAGVAGFGGGIIMLPILVWVLGVREAVPALTIAQQQGDQALMNQALAEIVQLINPAPQAIPQGIAPGPGPIAGGPAPTAGFAG